MPDNDTTLKLYNGTLHVEMKTVPVTPENIIFNAPATVVEWSDGTKTVVKCDEHDIYDERTGFLLCCAKKLMGNTGRYNDEMRGNVPDYHLSEAMVTELLTAVRDMNMKIVGGLVEWGIA